MAANIIDPDPPELIALAEHAHGLIDKFLKLPPNQRQRSWEVISELQNVIDEFKRHHPPPLFRPERALELVRTLRGGEPCAICLNEIESGENYMTFRKSVFHEGCLPPCWHCEGSVSGPNCARISHDGFDNKWRAVHIVCPER